MNLFLFNLLLALAWIALTGTFTPTNLVFGFAVSYLLLAATRGLRAPSGYFSKARRVIGFVVFVLWQITIASLRVAWIVLSPRANIRPAVVAIPLTVRSAGEITLLANLITLTPGSLFLDVSQDRCVMYVHAMHVDDLDAFRASIKNGFERRVMEVVR